MWITSLRFLAVIMSVYSPYSSVLRYYMMPDWGIRPNIDYVGLYEDAIYAGGCHSNQVVGNYAYVSGWLGNGWSVLDISTPSNPMRVGWIQDSAWYRTTHLSIDSSRDLLYSVSESSDTFSIVDISDVTDPYVISSFDDSTNMNTPVACAYTGNYCLVIARGDAGTSGILYVFDCTNEYSINIAARLQDDTNLENPRDIVISDDGNTAYIACRSEQIAVVDITTKTSPSVSSTVDLSSISCGAHSIQILSGASVIVCGTNTLAIVDTSGGTITGSYTNSTNLNNAYSVATYGDYAFVASRYGNSLTSIDISNTASPSFVSKYSDPDVIGGAYYVTVSDSGQYAYVSGYTSNTFAILDIRDPSDMGASAASILKPIRARRDAIKGRSNVEMRRKINGHPSRSGHVSTRRESSGPVDFEFAPYEYRELLAASINSTPVTISETTAADVTFSGSTITSAGTDFETAGVYAGQWIRVAGSGISAGNLGAFLVTDISSGTITVDGSLTGESGKTATITSYSMRDGIAEKPIYFERELPDGTNYLSFDNMVVRDLRLSVPDSGVCQGTITVEGGMYDYISTSAGTSGSWSTENPLDSTKFTSLYLDSTSMPAISFDLRISNTYSPIFERYQRGATMMVFKDRSITGSFKLFFDSVSEAESFADSQESSLRLHLSGDYDFVLYCPQVVLRTPTIGGVDRGWGVELDVEFEAQVDDTTTYSIQMDVV